MKKQTPAQTQQYKKRSQLAAICHRFAKNKSAMIGLVLLAVLVILAVSAPLFIDYKGEVIK